MTRRTEGKQTAVARWYSDRASNVGANTQGRSSHADNGSLTTARATSTQKSVVRVRRAAIEVIHGVRGEHTLRISDDWWGLSPATYW